MLGGLRVTMMSDQLCVWSDINNSTLIIVSVHVLFGGDFKYIYTQIIIVKLTVVISCMAIPVSTLYVRLDKSSLAYIRTCIS